MVFALALSAAACSDDASPVDPPAVTRAVDEPAGTDGGATPVPAEQIEATVDSLSVATLTSAERDGLLWMRDEEKLAFDVYQALYDRWQLAVFDNIGRAEATHTASVKTLLDRYGLTDPAAGMAVGSFRNPEIKALYDALVAQGSQSLVEALTVGATIEDLDIADLRARATDTPDIALVYANLEKGSRNHLRAFSTQMDGHGASYTPSHISQSDYDAIVGSAVERGPVG